MAENDTKERRLLLLRHGKSAWPDGVADHQRPLAPRGEAAVPLMARFLAKQLALPDLVLVSDARRTRETFAKLSGEIFGLAHRLEPRIYEAGAGSLLRVVNEVAEDVGTLMLVGHNPGMQSLALRLAHSANSAPDDLVRLNRKFPTAGLAELAFVGPWSRLGPGAARLASFTTPAMLGGTDED